MTTGEPAPRTTRAIPLGRSLLFWAIALAGPASTWGRSRTSSAGSASPPARPVTVIPNVLELQTSYNPGPSGVSCAMSRTAA